MSKLRCNWVNGHVSSNAADREEKRVKEKEMGRENEIECERERERELPGCPWDPCRGSAYTELVC